MGLPDHLSTCLCPTDLLVLSGITLTIYSGNTAHFYEQRRYAGENDLIVDAVAYVIISK